MHNTMVILVFYLVLLAGMIALQIFLSRKRAWWCGLILPALSLLLSLLCVFSYAAYSNHTVHTELVNEAGQVIAQTDSGVHAGPAETVGGALPLFLAANLPTLGLLAIYFVCRQKFKKAQEMEKMNIQDLE